MVEAPPEDYGYAAFNETVDTIIMGVESSGNTGTVHLGRTVEHVLMNATCAVWVVRQSMIPQADHHHE